MATYPQDVRKSDERLGELILYVASRCEYDRKFGATKLNKILFFADFLAWDRLGRTITGTRYQKLRNGPAPVRLRPVVRDLVKDLAAVQREVLFHNRQQKRVVPTREAKVEIFSGPEIALVNSVIDMLSHMSATDVSEYSHTFMGWQLAEEREEIPPYTMLIPSSPPEVTYEDRVIAARIAERLSA